MGRWVVEVQDERGEWWLIGDGVYSTPSPAEGGRPEDVIREEQEAAEKAAAVWTRPLRAYWEDA